MIDFKTSLEYRFSNVSKNSYFKEQCAGKNNSFPQKTSKGNPLKIRISAFSISNDISADFLTNYLI
jgi:hypothetical protein